MQRRGVDATWRAREKSRKARKKRQKEVAKRRIDLNRERSRMKTEGKRKARKLRMSVLTKNWRNKMQVDKGRGQREKKFKDE
jgi:hypothetical protein